MNQRVHRVSELARLVAHGHEVARLSDSRDIWAAAVRVLPDLLEVDASAVLQVGDAVASCVAQQGLDVELAGSWSSPVDLLPAAEAVQERRPCRGDLSDRCDLPTRGLRAFAAVPLVVTDRVVGLLHAFRSTRHPFTDAEVSLISLVASQTSSALERVAMLQAADDRRRRAEQLREVGRQVAGSLDAARVLERFGDALLEVTRACRVTLLLLDEDAGRLRVAGSHDASGPRSTARLEAHLATTSARSAGLLWDVLVERTARWCGPTAQPVPLLDATAADGHALLVQPLVANDHALGLVLLEHSGAPMDQDERDSVEQLAMVTAVALHNAQLYERVRADRAQLRALHDMTLSIGAANDLTATLQQITDAAARLTGATRCRLGLLVAPDAYRLMAMTGDSDQVGATYGLDAGVGGWITRTGRTIWTADMADADSIPAEAMQQARLREGSAAGVPLRGVDGRVRGFLSLHHVQRGQFRRDVIPLLERFGAEAVLAVDSSAEQAARLQLESRLREQAERDPLTGLANRTVLLDRLGVALSDTRSPRRVAVLYLDLDRFKSVNDSLGHGGGDELLVAVGKRLSRLVRTGDLVARLGGDEFVVLVDDVADPAEAVGLAQRMIAALGQPVAVAGSRIVVGASVGVVFVQEDGRTPASVLQDADIAMYQAKRTGRARCAVFDPAMRAEAVGRLPVETELRAALAQGGLAVHYQPLVDLRTGVVVGVEALARWPHPQRGWVPPEEFIAIAEHAGLIAEVDAFVLGAAAEQVRAWQALPGAGALRLNVNVSALSLPDDALRDQLVEVLARSGLATGSLVVELTETAAMQDPERSLVLCHQIRALGAQIAVDDFGNGYSNLAHLSRLPVDLLKIDRGLVRLLDGSRHGEALVRAVLALACALDLEVTAEGVETQAQADRLQALGCQQGQGYLYARPLPADEMTALLGGSLGWTA